MGGLSVSRQLSVNGADENFGGMLAVHEQVARLTRNPNGPTNLMLSAIPAQGFGEPAVAGAEAGDVAETGPR
jgi:hypothetical protein